MSLTPRLDSVETDVTSLQTNSLTASSPLNSANLTGNITAARITSALNASGSAPIYACRAWVNFSGTANTIRASGNVSSIGDGGTGNYTINFATALQDTNYCALDAQDHTYLNQDIKTYAESASYARVYTYNGSNGGAAEPSTIYLAFYR